MPERCYDMQVCIQICCQLDQIVVDQASKLGMTKKNCLDRCIKYGESSSGFDLAPTDNLVKHKVFDIIQAKFNETR